LENERGFHLPEVLERERERGWEGDRKREIESNITALANFISIFKLLPFCQL